MSFASTPVFNGYCVLLHQDQLLMAPVSFIHQQQLLIVVLLGFDMFCLWKWKLLFLITEMNVQHRLTDGSKVRTRLTHKWQGFFFLKWFCVPAFGIIVFLYYFICIFKKELLSPGFDWISLCPFAEPGHMLLLKTMSQ